MPVISDFSYNPVDGPRRSPMAAAMAGKSWMAQLVDLIRHRLGCNLLFLSAILIGFFHGWMKLHYRSGIITFAFDIPLTLSLLIVIATAPKTGVFPKGPISSGLKFLIATCALYGFLPFGVPALVALAAFRGWCFIPLIFLLGYYLTNSLRQIEMLTYLLMALGFVTAIYGLRQSPAEIRAMMESDPYVNMRLRNSFYGATGGSQFRVFSTFVSAAAFGGTMAFCSVFALSRMAMPGCTWKERLLLLTITGPMAYCIMLSGSRTALVMFVMALFFTGWYRKTLLQIAVPAAVVSIALVVASAMKGGAVLERFSTLLNPAVVHGRMRIVYGPALDNLMEAPFGGGLGRSGHGVPAIMGRLVKDFDWRPVDGDLGRLAVDMGIVGLVVFFLALIMGGITAFKMLKDLRDSSLATVALPAGSWFLISAICMPIGSPFLSIPVGPLTWFFLGSLLRLHEEYTQGPRPGSLPIRNERLASFIDTPSQTLYGSVKKLIRRNAVSPRSVLSSGGGGSGGEGPVPLSGPRPASPETRRRFLYQNRPVDESQAPDPAKARKGNESRSRRPRF